MPHTVEASAYVICTNILLVKTSPIVKLKIKGREVQSTQHEVKTSHMAKTNINGWGHLLLLREKRK